QVPQQARVVTPEPLVISELQGGRPVYGWLFTEEVETRRARTGRPYLHLKLRDQRGNEIVARQFDLAEEPPLQKGKVILLEGSVDEYQGKLSIKLKRVEVDETAPAHLFMLGTRRPLEYLEAEFQLLVSQVSLPGLCELLQCCFSPEVMARFRRWPA